MDGSAEIWMPAGVLAPLSQQRVRGVRQSWVTSSAEFTLAQDTR